MSTEYVHEFWLSESGQVPPAVGYVPAEDRPVYVRVVTKYDSNEMGPFVELVTWFENQVVAKCWHEVSVIDGSGYWEHRMAEYQALCFVESRFILS